MKDLRIIYIGTPKFAVPSLEILIENNFNVVAVITAPDKPSGRGHKIRTSAVKNCVLKHSIPLLQPKNLKAPEFMEELKSYHANLQIVVAFRMLPKMVWDMPQYGTFNLHASLLPQYRGAAPINWAIINGEKETGVTTFFLKHKIDTGDIIMQEKEPIFEDDNVESLHKRLMKKGASLVLKTVNAIKGENYPLSVQNSNQDINHAPKIFKATCEVNFFNTKEKVYNFIRGLSPYPAAWTILNGKKYKIFKSSKSENTISQDWQTDGKTYLKFKTTNGSVFIEELQLEGKKKMLIADFLSGNKII